MNTEDKDPIKNIEHIEMLGYGEDVGEDIQSHVQDENHEVIMLMSDKSVHLVEWPEED